MKTLNYRKVFAIYLACLGAITILSVLISFQNINNLFSDFGIAGSEFFQLNLFRVIAIIVGLLYFVASFFVWRKKQIEEALIGFRVSAISEVLLWIIAALPGFIALYLAVWGQFNKLVSYL